MRKLRTNFYLIEIPGLFPNKISQVGLGFPRQAEQSDCLVGRGFPARRDRQPRQSRNAVGVFFLTPVAVVYPELAEGRSSQERSNTKN